MKGPSRARCAPPDNADPTPAGLRHGPDKNRPESVGNVAAVAADCRNRGAARARSCKRGGSSQKKGAAPSIEEMHGAGMRAVKLPVRYAMTLPEASTR